MKDTLKPGLTCSFTFTVPENKTVPYLFPEAVEFQDMPKVLATGFLVGLIEWTCIQALRPHLDWPAEQTVGTRIDVAHLAATPPGLAATIRVRLTEVDGKRLVLEFEGDDGKDTITKGTHERFVIDAEKFGARLKKKMG